MDSAVESLSECSRTMVGFEFEAEWDHLVESRISCFVLQPSMCAVFLSAQTNPHRPWGTVQFNGFVSSVLKRTHIFACGKSRKRFICIISVIGSWQPIKIQHTTQVTQLQLANPASPEQDKWKDVVLYGIIIYSSKLSWASIDRHNASPSLWRTPFWRLLTFSTGAWASSRKK